MCVRILLVFVFETYFVQMRKYARMCSRDCVGIILGGIFVF